MKSYSFVLASDEDVILLDVRINGKFRCRVALDTAATHTTIDSNYLYVSGYKIENRRDTQQVETSNGLIVVDIFKVKSFACLGILKNEFNVQVYDFLAHGIGSNYDGVVGLNFLRSTRFCIDIPGGIVTLDTV